jgi:hypothetical protein
MDRYTSNLLANMLYRFAFIEEIMKQDPRISREVATQMVSRHAARFIKHDVDTNSSLQTMIPVIEESMRQE